MSPHTPLCDLLGIEHPIVGFTTSEHVAAAISRAGGLGVLGCVRFNDPAELDTVLDWMDRNTGGRPYGVDLLIPEKFAAGDPGNLVASLRAQIPDEHLAFVRGLLAIEGRMVSFIWLDRVLPDRELDHAA